MSHEHLKNHVRSRPCVWSALCVLTSVPVVLAMNCPFSPIQEASTVALQLVADGFVSPLGMAVPPDGSGRKFIVDQVGLVRIIEADDKLLPEPFLDLRDRMVQIGIDLGGGLVFDERGFLGLAFHPDYAQNGRFFVFYTAPKGEDIAEEFDSETHVSEFAVMPGDPNRADPASERILLRLGKPQFNHNGGQLAFGPDGMLYISIGDGGNANDMGDGHNPETGNGQDKSTLLGKLLRIDVNSGDPFAIPPDNPFAGDTGARPEIFAFGFRNPWRFSFEARGAQRLFVADVGQDLFEEVNIVEAGGNYGWRIREGAACFDPDTPAVPPADCPNLGADGEPLIPPILEYSHEDSQGAPHGLSVIGGFVYSGDAFPGLIGDYVFGDWSTSFAEANGSLFAARETNGVWQMRELIVADSDNGRLNRFLLGLGQDEEGEIYTLTTANVGPFAETGQVHRIVQAP